MYKEGKERIRNKIQSGQKSVPHNDIDRIQIEETWTKLELRITKRVHRD